MRNFAENEQTIAFTAFKQPFRQSVESGLSNEIHYKSKVLYSSALQPTKPPLQIGGQLFRFPTRKYQVLGTDKSEQVDTNELIPKLEKSSQTYYLPVKMNNRRKTKRIQCNLFYQYLQKPLCKGSRLCRQSKWFVKRLVKYNFQTNVNAPQHAAALALGLSEKAVSLSMKESYSESHVKCNDLNSENSHAPLCHIVKKRMSRREMWARSIKHIDGLIARRQNQTLNSPRILSQAQKGDCELLVEESSR